MARSWKYNTSPAAPMVAMIASAIGCARQEKWTNITEAC